MDHSSAVSALRDARCFCAGQPVSDLRQSRRVPDGIRAVHRRWFCARGNPRIGMGVLVQKTALR